MHERKLKVLKRNKAKEMKDKIKKVRRKKQK